MKTKPLPSLERLQELFTYNPETGDLCWRVSRGRAKAGQKVTYLDNHGYHRVRVDRTLHKVHRLVYLMMTGDDPIDQQIDHINHKTDDNRWANLRLATHMQNGRNTKLKSHNTTGVNGVQTTASGKFKARIQLNTKSMHLGTFDTLEEAAAARQQANRDNGFSATHGL